MSIIGKIAETILVYADAKCEYKHKI